VTSQIRHVTGQIRHVTGQISVVRAPSTTRRSTGHVTGQITEQSLAYSHGPQRYATAWAGGWAHWRRSAGTLSHTRLRYSPLPYGLQGGLSRPREWGRVVPGWVVPAPVAGTEKVGLSRPTLSLTHHLVPPAMELVTPHCPRASYADSPASATCIHSRLSLSFSFSSLNECCRETLHSRLSTA
jgi:hypothetical protein